MSARLFQWNSLTLERFLNGGHVRFAKRVRLLLVLRASCSLGELSCLSHRHHGDGDSAGGFRNESDMYGISFNNLASLRVNTWLDLL